MKDICFQILEYGGMPIALMLFIIINSKLASADPISDDENNEEIWSHGLEIMQIVFVSTTLYAISILGHTYGQSLSTEKLRVIIISLILSLIELVIIMFSTLKVRKWGIKSTKSNQYTNITALFFWITLVILIITSYSYMHHNDVSLKVKGELSGSIVDHSENIIITKEVFLYIIIGLVVIITLILMATKLIAKKEREYNAKGYSKALALAKSNPNKAIVKLKNSLSKTPDNSALIIDMYMKLATIYEVLDQNDKALEQIFLAQKTKAYSEYPYMKDAVLAYLIEFYLKTGKLDDAENMVRQITSEATSSKLVLKIFNQKGMGK